MHERLQVYFHLLGCGGCSWLVERLKDLESKEESGYLDKLPKKETAILKKELDKLRKNLNGIKDMKRLPDLVLIVDQKREKVQLFKNV